MAVKGSLPWRSWVMPRNWWEGGMLRETQSRVGDSVPNAALTPSLHQSSGFEFKVINQKWTNRI